MTFDDIIAAILAVDPALAVHVTQLQRPYSPLRSHHIAVFTEDGAAPCVRGYGDAMIAHTTAESGETAVAQALQQIAQRMCLCVECATARAQAEAAAHLTPGSRERRETAEHEIPTDITVAESDRE